MGNQLIKLLLKVFAQYWNYIAFNYNGVYYSYGDIYKSANILRDELDSMHSRPLRVALIAQNSIEWVIAFIAILMSKHQLVLYTPNCTLVELRYVLNKSRASILITDKGKELNISDSVFLIGIININTISKEESEHCLITLGEVKEEQYTQINTIHVFTQRHRTDVEIEYTDILQLLNTLLNSDIFHSPDTSSIDSYYSQQGYTYNYVLCLLLPLFKGVETIIPESNGIYQTEYDLRTMRLKTVIMTAYQFEVLYNNFIEPPFDKWNNFLKKLPFWMGRKQYLTKKLKEVFSDVERVIILNSGLNMNLEKKLIQLQFPITTTYGIVEAAGLCTYSSPSDYVFGSCGKTINGFVTVLMGDDELIWGKSDSKLIGTNDNGRIRNDYLYYHNRSGEIISTSIGCIPGYVERILKSIPFVKDCILTSIDEKVILLATIDELAASCDNLLYEDLTLVLESSVNELNERISSFERVSKVVILPGDFSRDDYGRVKKYLYQ